MPTPQYFPFLNAKDGESKAWRLVSDIAREMSCPVFDVSSNFGEPLDSSIAKGANAICGACVDGTIPFVDIFKVDLRSRLENGKHPLDFLFALLANQNQVAYPVIGLDRDAEYMNAAKRVLDKQRDKKALLRILREDILDLRHTIKSGGDLAREIAGDVKRVSVVIDIRALRQNDRREIETPVADALEAFSKEGYGEVIFAASAAPESWAFVPVRKLTAVARRDFEMWERLRDRGFLSQKFGDYGMVYPDYVEKDKTTLNPSAKVRYPTKKAWLVARGGSYKRNGGNQYRGLARLVRENELFRERSKRYPENYIIDCCDRGPTGGLSQWITVDMAAHIELTARQVDGVFSGRPVVYG